MTGQNKDGKNYGYITLTLPDSNKLKAWLWDLNYNPNTELVKMTVLKKEVIFVNEPNFSCNTYSNLTFAEIESGIAIPKKVEKCRFEDFN